MGMVAEAKMLSKIWLKLRRMKNGVSTLARLNLKKVTPIVVYQMGKVGSTSVKESLISCGLDDIYQIHRLHPVNIERVRQDHLKRNSEPLDERMGMLLYENVVNKRKRCKFITLVREPIGRNISAFFENFTFFTGMIFGVQVFSVNELTNIFLNNYPHSVPLAWFDEEMKRALNIDVYEHEFPKRKGYLYLNKDPFELLIIKCEIPDSIKERAISDFLSIDNFSLSRANLAQDKNYSEVYQSFKNRINLPTSYIEMMCDSKYMKHFYEYSEIESIRSKWLAKGHN